MSSQASFLAHAAVFDLSTAFAIPAYGPFACGAHALVPRTKQAPACEALLRICSQESHVGVILVIRSEAQPAPSRTEEEAASKVPGENPCIHSALENAEKRQ